MHSMLYDFDLTVICLRSCSPLVPKQQYVLPLPDCWKLTRLSCLVPVSPSCLSFDDPLPPYYSLPAYLCPLAVLAGSVCHPVAD